MEYVEGAELKGPLPVDRAVTLAGRILDALDAAHRKGITHRDLKPANVMVTKTGIKVLDFGLAKMARPESRDDEVTRAALTQDNTMLGTLYYMAPEQLQGRHDVDSRADIFAFGCVLYEMLTGKRAFDGSNAASIIAAVMERPAPSVEAVAPAALDRVLKRCLEKDPDDRWQNARDVRAALELTQFPASTTAHPAKARGWWMAAAAAAVIVTAIGAGWSLRRQPPTEAAPVRASLLAPSDSEFANPFVGYAVSPDGRLLVFSAQKKDAQRPTLWLRPLNALTATELPGTENGNGIFWSPDSKSIGFIADDKLKRMDVAGGPIQILCDAPDYEGGSWSTEGVILFGSSQQGLHRIPATGGTPQRITTPAIGLSGAAVGTRYPHFLPDGRHFLYTSAEPPGNAGKIFFASIDDPGQRVHLADSDAKAEYAPPRNGWPGYLLWVRDQSLVAQAFDGQSGLLKGDPLPVAEGLYTGFVSTGRRAAYSVSHTGVLVYKTGANGSQMTWIDRDGKTEAVSGATSDPRAGDPALSPDGRRVALERQIGTNFDVWVYELGRGVMTRLTFDPGIDWIPVWSPDGSEVIYGSTRKSGVGLYRREISGGGQDELLVNGSIVPSSWSRDGRYLLYNQGGDISVLPLNRNREDRKPVPYLQSPFRKFNAQFSPDGKWVAYVSDESGRSEVYIQAFPLSGGKWQVTSSGGTQPRWRGDGKELFFLSGDKLWAAGVRAAAGRVEIDPPRSLFTADVQAGPQYIYDVRPDGQRFLLTLPTNRNDSRQPISVISNWQAGLH